MPCVSQGRLPLTRDGDKLRRLASLQLDQLHCSYLWPHCTHREEHANLQRNAGEISGIRVRPLQSSFLGAGARYGLIAGIDSRLGDLQMRPHLKHQSMELKRDNSLL